MKITPHIARIMAQALQSSDLVGQQRVEALVALVENLARQIDAHEDDVRGGTLIPVQDLGERLGVSLPAGADIIDHLRGLLAQATVRPLRWATVALGPSDRVSAATKAMRESALFNTGKVTLAWVNVNDMLSHTRVGNIKEMS